MGVSIQLYVVVKDDKLRAAKEVHRLCLEHGETPPTWAELMVEGDGVRVRPDGLIEINLYSSKCWSRLDDGCAREINLESLQKLWPGAVGIVARLE